MALNIDGSILEGGGQILRNAFACCCLLQKEVVIDKIRGQRSPPGLRAQHTEGLVLVNRMCQGKLTGAHIGSVSVHFLPGKLTGGEFTADSGTAGSIALLSQVALPCMLFSPGATTLGLSGGTNASFAPQADYIQCVLLPTLVRMGIDAKMTIEKRGYFPRGQGHATVTAAHVDRIQPITLMDKGDIKEIRARVVISNLKPSVGERAVRTIKDELKRTPFRDVPLKTEILADNAAADPGVGVVIVAETTTGCLIAGDSLGKKGKLMEDVAKEAVAGLVEVLRTPACVDDYLHDQLVIFMALAIVTQTGAVFTTTTQDDGTVIITCDGIGFQGQPAA